MELPHDNNLRGGLFSRRRFDHIGTAFELADIECFRIILKQELFDALTVAIEDLNRDGCL